jgi:hypothetical protein
MQKNTIIHKELNHPWVLVSVWLPETNSQWIQRKDCTVHSISRCYYEDSPFSAFAILFQAHVVSAGNTLGKPILLSSPGKNPTHTLRLSSNARFTELFPCECPTHFKASWEFLHNLATVY